ncbi:hypothetical protein [Calothrix sp. UHCC 0171]|nr:hypothetical protein [Calothrix sp. UHCC 0171]MEA5573461.1 hypothetical protein [Calothrix sp. UHCC 0171]
MQLKYRYFVSDIGITKIQHPEIQPIYPQVQESKLQCKFYNSLDMRK